MIDQVFSQSRTTYSFVDQERRDAYVKDSPVTGGRDGTKPSIVEAILGEPCQPDSALWPLLLRKGKRWQRVVLDVFRQLPQEQLDADVLLVLSEMLAVGDEDIQIQVLDILKAESVAQSAPADLVSGVCELATRGGVSIRRRATLVLGGTSETDLALPVLFQALTDSRHSVRKNAVSSLAKIGDARAVQPLIRALQDTNEGVRRRAAEALGRIGDVRAVEPLIRVLKDADDLVRQAAAEALGRLEDPRAVEPLVAALQDYYVNVRWAVMEALARLGDSRVLGPLTSVLEEENRDVRLRAVKALSELGAPAVEPLVTTLKDGDLDVRRAAAEALERLGEPVLEPLVTAFKNGNGHSPCACAEVLERLGDLAVDPLIVALADDNPDVRQRATRLLGQVWDLTEVSQLGSDDWKLRIEACWALGRLGDTRAVVPVAAVLKDNHPIAKRAAVKALGQLADARAAEPLIAALKESNPQVRSGAAEALGRLGDVQAVEPLIEAFNDSDKSVRRAAAEALERLGEPAIEPLIAALNDSREVVQRRAAQVLANLADVRTVEPFRAALKKGDGIVRWEAVRALTRIGTRDALAALEEYEMHKRRRAWVKQFLSKAFIRGVPFATGAGTLAWAAERVLH